MAVFICTLTFLQCKTGKWCVFVSVTPVDGLLNCPNVLGLGDQEGVVEEEEVPLLRLQACLQLCLDVTREETGWTLGEEGLDKGA